MLLLYILLVLVVLLCIWACIEQHLLRVQKVQLQVDAAQTEVRIFQVSDIHKRQLGKHNRRIVEKAAAFDPDVIVITGDLASRTQKKFDKTAQFLKALREVAPVYMVLGNHELEMEETNYQALLEVLRTCDCRLLQNETVPLKTRDGRDTGLFLVGATLSGKVYRNENGGHHHLEPYTVDDLTRDVGPKPGPCVLLAHNPLLVETYAGWGADVVLCGHMHGGSVRLPFVGGVLSPERKFFPKYDKGYFRVQDTQMWITGGIGKPRLFNPPEVADITITPHLHPIESQGIRRGPRTKPI